jgi:hypothetical protein
MELESPVIPRHNRIGSLGGSGAPADPLISASETGD